MGTAFGSLSQGIAPPASSEWSSSRKVGVVLLHFTIALLGSVNTGKGVFFPKLVEAFSISHAMGAALISASGLVGSVLTFVVAMLTLDRLPIHRVLVIVPLVSGAGLLCVSFAQTYPQLLFGYLLTGGGLLNQIAIAFLLSTWFKLNRGLALALVYAGSTTGGVLLTPLLGYIVDAWDWRAGYRAIACAILILAPLLHVMLKHDSRKAASRAERADVTGSATLLPGLTVRQAIVTRSFWLIVLANFVFGANTGTYFVHFISLLESCGYSTSEATWTMSQLFLLAAVAKIVFGCLGDRYDLRWALAVSLLMAALGWGLMGLLQASQPSLYAFTLIRTVLFGAAGAVPAADLIGFRQTQLHGDRCRCDGWRSLHRQRGRPRDRGAHIRRDRLLCSRVRRARCHAGGRHHRSFVRSQAGI